MVCTRVVNRSRRRGYDVYVGRPTCWGNRYVVRSTASKLSLVEQTKIVIVDNILDALHGYDSFLKLRTDLVERARVELKGKVLGCWCVDDLSGKEPIVCHAQILARVADGHAPPILKPRSVR